MIPSVRVPYSYEAVGELMKFKASIYMPVRALCVNIYVHYCVCAILSVRCVSTSSRPIRVTTVQFQVTRCVLAPPSHSTLLLPGRISNPSALLLISLLPCASCKGTKPHSHFFGDDPLNITPGSWTVPLRFRSWPIPPVVSPPSSSSSDPSMRGAPTVEPRRCRWRFMRHAERGLLGLAGI